MDLSVWLSLSLEYGLERARSFAYSIYFLIGIRFAIALLGTVIVLKISFLRRYVFNIRDKV